MALLETLYWYFLMVWKSFFTTIVSGTAAGIFIAQAVIVAAFGLLFIWMVYLFWKAINYKRRRASKLAREFKTLVKGKLMSAKDRDDQLKLIAIDRLTDAFEEAYFLGEISLEEKDALYGKIAKAYGWEDLLTFAKASKKEQIKRKLDPASQQYAYKKVILPEPKPAGPVTRTLRLFKGNIFKRKVPA